VSIPSNWQKYIDLLSRKRIPDTQQRWYVKRVENFLKNYPGKKLQAFSAPDLEAYFQQLSRDMSLAAWQYRQTVHALQLLFLDLSATSLAKTVDWDYWKEAFVELKSQRTSLSKEITPHAMVAKHAAVKFPPGSDSDDVLQAPLRFLPDKVHKACNPGVCTGIAVVCKARHQVDEDKTVVTPVNTGATQYMVGIHHIVG